MIKKMKNKWKNTLKNRIFLVKKYSYFLMNLLKMIDRAKMPFIVQIQNQKK